MPLGLTSEQVGSLSGSITLGELVDGIASCFRRKISTLTGRPHASAARRLDMFACHAKSYHNQGKALSGVYDISSTRGNCTLAHPPLGKREMG